MDTVNNNVYNLLVIGRVQRDNIKPVSHKQDLIEVEANPRTKMHHHRSGCIVLTNFLKETDGSSACHDVARSMVGLLDNSFVVSVHDCTHLPVTAE